jgi:hypothetical protein
MFESFLKSTNCHFSIYLFNIVNSGNDTVCFIALNQAAVVSSFCAYQYCCPSHLYHILINIFKTRKLAWQVHFYACLAVLMLTTLSSKKTHWLASWTPATRIATWNVSGLCFEWYLQATQSMILNNNNNWSRSEIGNFRAENTQQLCCWKKKRVTLQIGLVFRGLRDIF